MYDTLLRSQRAFTTCAARATCQKTIFVMARCFCCSQSYSKRRVELVELMYPEARFGSLTTAPKLSPTELRKATPSLMSELLTSHFHLIYGHCVHPHCSTASSLKVSHTNQSLQPAPVLPHLPEMPTHTDVYSRRSVYDHPLPDMLC